MRCCETADGGGGASRSRTSSPATCCASTYTRSSCEIPRTARPRNGSYLQGHDIHGRTLTPDYDGPLRLFASRPWHDMLASLLRVEATGHVNCGLHHHLVGSADGFPHNDLNPGWFPGEVDGDGIRLAEPTQCEYTSGVLHSPSHRPAVETVRAAAAIFYLDDPPWSPGDGGMTGLYRNASDPIDQAAAVVPPVNNSLLAFECTPFSYHGSSPTVGIRGTASCSGCTGPSRTSCDGGASTRLWATSGTRGSVEVIVPKRVCLLTGASGRLGTAFCRRNASRYDIVAVYHSRFPQLVSQCSSLADPLAPEAESGENEHPVFTVQADLTRDDDIARLVEVALARFGRIDLLVNCAACSTRERALDQQLFPPAWSATWQPTSSAPARLALAVARA